jgi:hypothetical protein
MWPAAVGVNDDGGERPGGDVFGHITPAIESGFSHKKRGVFVEPVLTVP